MDSCYDSQQLPLMTIKKKYYVGKCNMQGCGGCGKAQVLMVA